MPTTRRRRANPPEQPENNNNNHTVEQSGHAAEVLPAEEATIAPAEAQQTTNSPDTALPTADHTETPAEPAQTVQPAQTEPPTPPPSQAFPTAASASNGERAERIERQDYTPTIEGGRRTARGELFRKPPQPPSLPPVNVQPPQQLQTPTHEISLPLGNLLHLAYNPGYTGADEARSALLHQLAHESKNGGRARCWSCGSLAIAYDRWNTRSKTFGEVGIAFCEICGVWSVM